MKKCYTEGQFISFVEKAFGESKPAGGNNIQISCPRCKKYKTKEPYYKRKLAIRITVPHIVHCWVCGLGGKNIYNLVKNYSPENLSEYKDRFLEAEELLAIDNPEEQKFETVQLPTGFSLLSKMVNGGGREQFGLTNRYVDQALDYLWEKRGIKTEEELWYWKLGVTETEARCRYRIVLPSFDENGAIAYWTGRSWLNRPKSKYKNPFCERREVVFNELNIDWNQPLTIVEGPFDLLKANQNATAVLGSEDMTLDFALVRKIIINKTPVVLAFDPEFFAQKKQFKLANRLLEFDIPVKIFEYKDKNKDIGDMEKNEFISLLQDAKVYTYEYELRKKIGSILVS